MTRYHEWNPMPHMLDIKCPKCGKKARFEFAEVVKIALKKDIPFFQQCPLFEYQIFQDSCGHFWHGAIYYAGLHGSSVSAIQGVPEGYEASNWEHSEYLYRSHGLDIGSVRCANCKLSRKHELSWPAEAYYSVEYKRQMLWAFNL